MAYGFSATGDNSSYLLDSTKENTVHFSIHTKGSVSAGQSVSKGHSDLMFAKPSSTSSTANSRVTFDAVSNGGQVTFYKGETFQDYLIPYHHLQFQQHVLRTQKIRLFLYKNFYLDNHEHI